MATSVQRAARQQGIARLFNDSADLYAALLDVDPYSLSYGSDLAARANSAAPGLFENLGRMLPGSSPVAVLANAWAVATQDPKWVALLYRSAVATGQLELHREATRLLKASIGDLDEPARAIVNADCAGLQVPPNLGRWTHLKPGMRLRYALAHHWATGATAKELLEVAAAQPNASTYLRARELARALRAGHSLRPKVSALSEVEFLMLPVGLQGLAMANPELRALALPSSLAGRPDIDRVIEASRTTQEHSKRTLDALGKLLLCGSFEDAAPLIESLGADEITGHLANAALGGLMVRIDASSRRREPKARTSPGVVQVWVPLPRAAAEHLASLVAGLRLPSWWSLSAKEIAHGLANASLDSNAIGVADFLRIQQGWSNPEYDGLAKVGRFDLLPPTAAVWQSLSLQAVVRAALTHLDGHKIVAARVRTLPDARPILALLSEPEGPAIKALVVQALKSDRRKEGPNSWDAWVVNCIGSPEWHANEHLALAGMRLISVALAMLKTGVSPVDGEGFRSAMVDLLVRGYQETPEDEGAILRYLALEPQAAEQIARGLPEGRMRRLLAHPQVSLSVLDRFMAGVPEALKEAIWHARLRRARTAGGLRSKLLEHAGVAGPIPWSQKWLEIGGSDSERAVALVLACRRDAKRLRRIVKHLGEEVFKEALRAAIADLPPIARRDKGFLELVAALGISQIPYLSAVMAMAARKAAAGHKLDHAYQQYLLPKKSGGSRVISAPHSHLKRIQRAVLDRLVQPLGAHECAFGFVRGRSIKDNAAVHVGRPIVANADVSNCFPSVKWTLVLGVLRRDLGQQLSPGAISLLVDICTADGGLPIGAPTSPALLNRVLVHTDQVLHLAAMRLNCHYSRYADDLTFSGDHGAVRLLGVAARTLSQIGLALDPKKTNIYRPGRRQMVTGLVVNERVSVPRRLRRRMRAAVHAVEQGRNPVWHGQEEQVTSLQGRLAFVTAINPAQAVPLAKRLLSAIHLPRKDGEA